MNKNVLKAIYLIAKAARRYVLGDKDNGNSNPYDINTDIKKMMGVQIFYAKNLPFDGCIKWNSSAQCPMIIISQDDSYYRQEFTVAHELGHLLLNWQWIPGKGLDKDALSQAKKQYNIMGVYYRGYPGQSKKPIEQEADEFSAEFLMPREGVKRLYKKAHTNDLNSIKFDVSENYNVSTDAAFHRLDNLKKRGAL